MQCVEFALARAEYLTPNFRTALKAANLDPVAEYTYNPKVLVHHPALDALLKSVLSIAPRPIVPAEKPSASDGRGHVCARQKCDGEIEVLKSKVEALQQADSILKKSFDEEIAKAKIIVDGLQIQVTKVQTEKAGLCKDIAALQQDKTASKKKIASVREQRVAQKEKITAMEEQQTKLKYTITAFSISNAQLVSRNETLKKMPRAEAIKR